jgi:RNA polymerase sigma factor (sigma-70 family)
VHVEEPQRLVTRAQAGDADAFGQLIARHERTALALAFATVGEASAASDVVQDAFLRAWQRMGELKDPARFGAWLGRIVRNMATDAVRRRRGPPAEPLDDRHVAAAATANEAAGAADQDLHRSIDAALAMLDDVTRSAVVLRYFEDLSSKQIGELLELSPAAVDMRLSRARAQLREKLTLEDVTL